MQMNAREAMHVLELRTTPQGHPAYRSVCQEMHRLIAEEAGHRALADAMRTSTTRRTSSNASRRNAPPKRAAPRSRPDADEKSSRPPDLPRRAIVLVRGPALPLTERPASGVLLTHPCPAHPVVGLPEIARAGGGSKGPPGPRRPSRERWNNPPARSGRAKQWPQRSPGPRAHSRSRSRPRPPSIEARECPHAPRGRRAVPKTRRYTPRPRDPGNAGATPREPRTPRRDGRSPR